MALIEGLFNRTFTVQRRTRTSDGQGGWAVGYVTIGTVQGRMRPATSAERETAAQEGRAITQVLYVLGTADVARGDQVISEGIAVDVLGVRDPSNAGHHLEIDCREMQAEATEEAS